jgi:hypothetical protein
MPGKYSALCELECGKATKLSTASEYVC